MPPAEEERRDALEQLLDRDYFGHLTILVEDLAEILGLKAEHIRVNWQDSPMAARYNRNVAIMQKTADRLRKSNT